MHRIDPQDTTQQVVLSLIQSTLHVLLQRKSPADTASEPAP